MLRVIQISITFLFVIIGTTTAQTTEAPPFPKCLGDICFCSPGTHKAVYNGLTYCATDNTDSCPEHAVRLSAKACECKKGYRFRNEDRDECVSDYIGGPVYPPEFDEDDETTQSTTTNTESSTTLTESTTTTTESTTTTPLPTNITTPATAITTTRTDSNFTRSEEMPTTTTTQSTTTTTTPLPTNVTTPATAITTTRTDSNTTRSEDSEIRNNTLYIYIGIGVMAIAALLLIIILYILRKQ